MEVTLSPMLDHSRPGNQDKGLPGCPEKGRVAISEGQVSWRQDNIQKDQEIISQRILQKRTLFQRNSFCYTYTWSQATSYILSLQKYACVFSAHWPLGMIILDDSIFEGGTNKSNY